MEYTGGARVGTLSLVGDVMLQTSFASQPWAKDPRFRAVLDELSQTDVVVANLEMPLSRRGSKMLKHSNLRSDPAIIEDVRAMGIHAVTLANNHMMDYGPLGLLDTVKVCDRAGLLHCGAGANLDAALAPAWLDVAGQRVALRASRRCGSPSRSRSIPTYSTSNQEPCLLSTHGRAPRIKTPRAV